MKSTLSALALVMALLAFSCEQNPPVVVTPGGGQHQSSGSGSQNVPDTGDDEDPGDDGQDSGETQTGEQYSSETYTNPLTTGSWADPTIWRSGSNFYTYSTMGSSLKKMKRSTDLVHWTDTVTPFSQDTDNTLKAYGGSRWAPDVVKIGDKWMMYFTCRNDSSSGIVALSSDTAAGPFTIIGRITYSGDTGIKDSIDPEVVKDPETGKVWLFFGSTGKMHRVELNSTGTALAEGAQYVHVAGVDVNQNSARDKVFEGAYLYRRDGWWYLFASAAQYWNYTYKVVVGRSRTIDGEFLDRQGRKMTDGYSTPVITSASGDRFFGPGHNGEIFTDTFGHDYILYHCHDSSAGNDDKRFLMLQEIRWDAEGWPYVEGGKPCLTAPVPVF